MNPNTPVYHVPYQYLAALTHLTMAHHPRVVAKLISKLDFQRVGPENEWRIVHNPTPPKPPVIYRVPSNGALLYHGGVFHYPSIGRDHLKQIHMLILSKRVVLTPQDHAHLDEDAESIHLYNGELLLYRGAKWVYDRLVTLAMYVGHLTPLLRPERPFNRLKVFIAEFATHDSRVNMFFEFIKYVPDLEYFGFVVYTDHSAFHPIYLELLRKVRTKRAFFILHNTSNVPDYETAVQYVSDIHAIVPDVVIISSADNIKAERLVQMTQQRGLRTRRYRSTPMLAEFHEIAMSRT